MGDGADEDKSDEAATDSEQGHEDDEFHEGNASGLNVQPSHDVGLLDDEEDDAAISDDLEEHI